VTKGSHGVFRSDDCYILLSVCLISVSNHVVGFASRYWDLLLASSASKPLSMY
jgi:hypothetical protein